jgi:hypothetical protein
MIIEITERADVITTTIAIAIHVSIKIEEATIPTAEEINEFI